MFLKKDYKGKKMKKYNDIFEGTISEVKETPKDKQFLATAKIKWGKSDFRNLNGRMYSDLVATPAILKFNKEAQAGAGKIGQLDHPQNSGGTLLSQASHLVNRVYKDDSKVWWADCKILNTTKGKDLLTVLRTGSKIGASLRGIGEIDKQGNVKAGVEFKAIDFVSSPSFDHNATVDKSDVFESFVPEDTDQFDEEDLKEITKAMAGLSDSTIEMIHQKLETNDGILMTEERIKGLILWIKCSKDDKNILPFDKWFEEQQKKFGTDDPNFQEELNSNLRRQANFREEKRMADSPHNANLMFTSRTRIEDRQREIDEALKGSRYDSKTISRLFAEAILAGYTKSRADWIKEFGF